MRQQRLGDCQHANHVRIELPTDLLHRERLERTVGAVTGIVHEHVDRAEAGTPLSNSGLD